MSIDVMKQALEALERGETKLRYEAITALRDRLAQPQVQPCAGRNCGSTNPNLHSAECFEDYEKSTGMAQPDRIQLTVRDFVVTVGGIEDAVGTPMYWAEWPNKEKK